MARKKKNRILIIEDYMPTSGMIKDLLSLSGYNVSAAQDGVVGLEMAFSEKPDLILLDVMMPGMNGFEVCSVLKADPKTKAIPVIIVSVKAAEDDVKAGKGEGADDYLVKPFDPDELMKLIKKHLK